ncbi:hypothetical protein [Streptomyces canus]|uniref:hypothetical protein n=1 Tax=Streptomyces canus TaxID=58343 RepID=UPI002E357650|nr:hypothetical protein [Streptomyces canus]
MTEPRPLGRTWHHHVTLVTAAQAFLALRRYDPEARTAAAPCNGTCTTCGLPPPPEPDDAL